MTPRQVVGLATELHFALDYILRNSLHCVGFVSHAICKDIVIHHSHDIERLYAVHQKLVHPSKHVGYLGFWIRKLKPVSNAFPIAVAERALQGGHEVEPFEEVADINEQISLHYSLELLISYVREKNLPSPNKVSSELFIKRIRKCFTRYLNEEIGDGPSLSSRLESIIYDMRYRTFGPHHVVTIMNTLIREAEVTK